MAAALKRPQLMTVDAFLDWDSPGPYVWQLVDGQPMAMAPPSPRHGAIQAETGAIIRNYLAERGGPCVVVTTPGVRPRFQSDRNFLVPDLAVTCSPADLDRRFLSEPILLIEILSPSNHAETWRNVWAYMTIGSLREILVIRSNAVGIELLRRNEDGTWPEAPTPATSGMFELASIGLELPVAALYRGSGLA